MCLRFLLSLLSGALQPASQQGQQPYNSHQASMIRPQNQPFQTFQQPTSQPISYQQPGVVHLPLYSHGHHTADGPTSYPPVQQPNNMSWVSDPSFAWGSLITQSSQPNPLFTRLIDAIFNYFNDGPTSQGFDPIKYAAVFTALMYTDDENKPRYFFIFATRNCFPSPEAFVNDAMDMLYRHYGIPFTTRNGQPVLTREGFHHVMLRDTLGDPEVQCKRFNIFLQNHGQRLLDPTTGVPFPTVNIPRTAFPQGSDMAVLQRAKQCQEEMNRELAVYLKDMTALAQNVHASNMAGIYSLSVAPVTWTEVSYTTRHGPFM